MRQAGHEILIGIQESFELCAKILSVLVLPIVAFVNHDRQKDDKP